MNASLFQPERRPTPQPVPPTPPPYGALPSYQPGTFSVPFGPAGPPPRPPRRNGALPWVAGGLGVLLMAALAVTGAIVLTKKPHSGTDVPSQSQHALPPRSDEKAKAPGYGTSAKYGYVDKLCDALNLGVLKAYANQVESPPEQKTGKTDPVEDLGGLYIMDCGYSLKQDAARAEDIKHLRLAVDAKVGYGSDAVEHVQDSYSEAANADKRTLTGLGQRAYDTFGDGGGADEGGRDTGTYYLGLVDSNLHIEISVDFIGSFNKDELARTIQQLAKDLMTTLQVT